MSYIKRLNRAFENAPLLPITSNTKYVFFSDCHRGIGNNNDNFLKNQNCYLAALQYYYQNAFCYIEVGDGDELWENENFNQIREIHENVFSILSCFQECNRFYMLYGNHDMVKKCDTNVHEGIIFHSETPLVNLRVTHGHQADFLNSVLWKFARFLVRHLWTPLESFGLQDPTSAAKNNTKREKVERKLIDYAKSNDCLIICGHTHRPTIGNRTSPYFNCGSCVQPKGITCLELNGFCIKLVKWYVSSNSLHIHREVLEEFSIK